MTRPQKFLKEIRCRSGLSQVDLAQMVGSTKQNIWNLENCLSDGSPEIWDRLEKVLKVDQRLLRQLDKE